MGDDLELLDAWAAGDKKAARVLFDRHFDALYRFFRTKTPTAVEDLVQDTLLACISSRDRFRREASFRTWLLATARNVLLMHLRRKQHLDRIDPAQESIFDMDPSPSAVLFKAAEQRLLHDALRRLPIDDQIVLELYYWEKLSGPELAITIGITEAALRSRLHRAKQALKRHMEQLAAEEPSLAASTWAGLDAWAEECRAVLNASRDEN